MLTTSDPVPGPLARLSPLAALSPTDHSIVDVPMPMPAVTSVSELLLVTPLKRQRNDVSAAQLDRSHEDSPALTDCV